MIKGSHHTSEAKEKNRLAHMGKKHTLEAKTKVSRAMKGRVLTEEWKKKIGQSNYKGNNISYSRLHGWVKEQLGAPKECWHCGINDNNRWYDWANKSGLYKRNIDDWLRLCRPCHRKYDGVTR